jgi:hypothetical protein
MTFTTSNSTVAGSSAIIIPLDSAKPTTSATKSFEAVREHWQRQISPNYSPMFFKIAIALSWYFNGKRGGEAWPMVETLAADTGASKSTVLRALKAFEDNGDLEVRRARKPDGTQDVNLTSRSSNPYRVSRL